MTAQQRRHNTSSAGFSLVEALVAMALMGMILAALATVTAQWLPNWNRGLAQLQRNEQIALGIERMVADLAAAEFITVNRDTPQPWFDGATHAVTFVRIGVGPQAGPGLEIVRLAEVSDGRQPLLVRTRALFAPVTPGALRRNEPNFIDPVVLLRGPYRLSFSYAGKDRVWRDTWRQQIELPRAIKLSLRDAASQKTLLVSTATPVHAEASVECIAATSLAECLKLQTPRSEPAEQKSRS